MLYTKWQYNSHGTAFTQLIDRLIDRCLTPTLTLFQLYRGVYGIKLMI